MPDQEAGTLDGDHVGRVGHAQRIEMRDCRRVEFPGQHGCTGAGPDSRAEGRPPLPQDDDGEKALDQRTIIGRAEERRRRVLDGKLSQDEGDAVDEGDDDPVPGSPSRTTALNGSRTPVRSDERFSA